MTDESASGEHRDPSWLGSSFETGAEESDEDGQHDEPVEEPVSVGVAESGRAGSPVNGGRGPAKPKVVPHFTRAERAARGKAARAEVPRSSQAEIEFPERRDPIALLEEQAVSRVPELVPIRYGRMLVSPFAFYRGGALIMAADLVADAELGSARAAVRGRASVELRRVRLAGAEPGVRHQRLRRDGAGPVGVGREAAGGELRDRRPRERLLRQGAARRSCSTTVRAYREAMGDVRADAQPRGLVLAPVRSSRRSREFTAGVDPKRLKRAEADIAKSRTKDSMQAFEKLTHVVDGEPRIISDPPLIVPIDELLPTGTEREAARGGDAQSRPRLPADAGDRPPPPAREFRFVDLARKVVGRRQRRHARLDRPLPRHRRPGPAVPAGQGSAARRCSSSSWARASTATAASASSPASG